MNSVHIRSKENLDSDFGQVGLKVSQHKSSPTVKAEKEWWLLRRYISSLYLSDNISGSLLIKKSERPNFLAEEGSIDGIEITEATTKKDSREAAHLVQNTTGPQLLGYYGGRGLEGFAGRQPELMVADDVMLAISRKANAFENMNKTRCHLLIYVNSNPGVLFENTPKELSLLGDKVRKAIYELGIGFAVSVLIKRTFVLCAKDTISLIPCHV